MFSLEERRSIWYCSKWSLIGQVSHRAPESSSASYPFISLCPRPSITHSLFGYFLQLGGFSVESRSHSNQTVYAEGTLHDFSPGFSVATILVALLVGGVSDARIFTNYCNYNNNASIRNDLACRILKVVSNSENKNVPGQFTV